MKKILCSVLCLVMTVSLFGCKNAVFNKEVNARDMMEQLVRTDKELGIKGKYEKIKDIKDNYNKLDEDLAEFNRNPPSEGGGGGGQASGATGNGALGAAAAVVGAR